MADSRIPDVSFIIPVLGDAPFVWEAISSALEVSPSRTEVIVVLDGSESPSSTLVGRLKSGYPGVTILSRPHAGAGAARNHGLTAARGEFVSFVDADDLIESESMRRLLMAARAYNSDVICGLLECFCHEKRWIARSWKSLCTLSAINTSCVEHPEALRHNSACGKLYRRAFLQTHSIAFPTDVHRGEDWQFSLSVIRQSAHLTLVPEVVYRYRKYNELFYTPSSSPCPKLLGDLLIVRDRLNALYEGFDTPQMRLTRDTHFTESIGTHLWRLSNKSESHGDLLPVLSHLSRALSTMSPATLERQAYRERLGFELIRVGALLGGLALFGKRSIPAIQQLRRFPEVSHDARALLATKEFSGRYGWTLKALRVLIKYLRERIRPLTDDISCLGPLLRGKALSARMMRRFRPNGSAPWVLGERGGYIAYDSSFYFFQWMRTHHPSVPCYFVVEPRQVEAVPVELRPWVLHRGTWAHYRRLYQASVLVFNFSGVDLCRDWRLLGMLGHLPKPTVRVFLNHGITSIHKVNGLWHHDQMAKRHDECDIFTVSSSRERSFLIRDMGHSDNHVFVTGLTRLDGLAPRKRSAAGQRRLLYIPTWRPWLRYGTKEAFIGSRFYAEVAVFMSSPELQDFLNQADAELIVLAHHVFKPFMSQFKVLSRGRVVVRDMNTENTQALLASADLVITDYSSASFDCVYMEIPVVYFQFDQEHFYQERGGFFVDPIRELPGKVVKTREELLTELFCVAKRDWLPVPEFASRATLFFDHRDGKNCARLYDVIQTKLSRALHSTGKV